jgi:glycosyltransferase involved in cell wall biosynthesis
MKRFPLRIVLISSIKYWGGGEAWMLSVARGLSQRGHRICLVCQPGSRLAKRALAAGIAPVLMRMRADFDPIVVLRLHHLLRDRKIHMVCANMDKEVRLAGLAARMAGIPLIRRRGSDMPFPNKLRFRLVDRLLVAGIMVNSRATRKTLLEGNRWLSEKRLHLIYNGIQLRADQEGSADKVVREFSLSGSYPVLAMVALLKSRKGHEVLFRAVHGIMAEFPQVALLVVGEGPLRSHLEALAQRLGIADRVRFAGFRDDVPALMAAADMVVLPSQNEGFGYVLAEAMALAKPVVASRISSIPEVVEEGHTGWLVPPNDSLALQEALLDLARDPLRAKQMGLAGQRRVNDLFSLEGMLDEVEELFEKIVGEGGFRWAS